MIKKIAIVLLVIGSLGLI